MKISVFLVSKDVYSARIKSIVLIVKLVILWLKTFNAKYVKVVKNANSNKILWFVIHAIKGNF